MPEIEPVTSHERMVVIGLFGTIAIVSLLMYNDMGAASGYLTAIATYYLSRNGV